MELSGSDRGGRSARRVAAGVLAALAVSVLLSVGAALSGCGSESADVRNCTREAQEILADLTTGLAAVRQPVSMPLADSGGAKEALAEFRATISENQERLDRMHAPEPCRETVRALRLVVAEGRDEADVSMQFADYMGQAGPLAEGIVEFVASVSGLKPEARTAYGLVGLKNQADRLLTEYYSVVPPAALREIHSELGGFLLEMKENVDKAAEVAPRDLPGAEEEGGEDEGREGERNPGSRKATSADRYLDEIPEMWEEVNGRVSLELARLRESSGYTGAGAEFDNAVLAAQALIAGLEEKYGKAPAEKKK